MQPQNIQHILTNHVEDVIIVSDKNGYVTWANKWFEQISGYSFDEIKGKKPGSFLQGAETDQETVSLMREAILAGQGFNVNIINYSKAGKKYWLNINCSPIFDDSGDIESFVAIERDITSEHNKNQDKLNILINELQNLSNEKSKLIELIYLLTHDLKAPMNNIEQLFDLIDVRDKEIGSMITSEISRSKKLIDKILSNGNTSLKTIELEISDFTVLELIKNLHDINKINLSKTNLSVAIDCPKQISLHSDKILITQVLENLFVNAIKYSNAASEIKFEVKQFDDTITIVISNETDTLEEWQLSELFKPFQNFNLNATENSTGIGSFIVYKYLGLVGGGIEVSKINNRVFFAVSLKKSIEKQNIHLRAV